MDTVYWSQISQILIALSAFAASGYAAFQYDKNQKNKKIDIALDAIKAWDGNINKYTSAAIDLVSKCGRNRLIMNKIKNNQAINLHREKHVKNRYAFLMNDNGTISGEEINEIRLSLGRYLNATEGISELYFKGRADKSVIDEQFSPEDRADVLRRLEPFIAQYDNKKKGIQAWAYVRKLRDEAEKQKRPVSS